MTKNAPLKFRRMDLPGLLPVVVMGVAVAFLAGCGQVKEVFSGRSASDSTRVAQSSGQQQKSEPFLPRPAFETDTLPPVPDVNLAEYDALLDRARLHLVLATKAVQMQDTLAAIDECTLASQKLDRAGYLPGIESDSVYGELSRSLLSLYKRCAPTIIRQGIEVPSDVLASLADSSASSDTLSLQSLTFKEPPPTTIPLPLTPDVEKNIVYFTTKMRTHFTRWLERSGKYFPVMRPILREEGLPDEIIFLTMIESGVNPLARSWAKCVGLWQFLKSTGELYGLKGDYYTDDRRNPEKATRAAARHLRDLYNRYKDWHLALAAYNAGPGRIDRAIARSRVPNPTFWDVQEYLPVETQNYVPRYVAAAIVGLNPESYDFTDVNYQRPLDYDVASIDKSYKVEDLAECAGISVEEFLEYNPSLLQPVTPPSVGSFELHIPKGRAETFASNITGAKPVTVAEVEYHKVKRGETIFKIARLYGIGVDVIRKSNGMRHTRRLTPGEMLRIPKMPSVDNASYQIAMDNLASRNGGDDEPDPLRGTSGKEKRTFKVERGMTLGGIAARYGVTVHEIMTWNGMKSLDVLSPGREMAVWVRPGTKETDSAEVDIPRMQPLATADAKVLPDGRKNPEIVRALVARAASKQGKAERYRVKHGETLASIANAFHVTIESIKSWNHLPNAHVRTGKVLTLYPNPVLTAENIRALPKTESRPAGQPETKKQDPAEGQRSVATSSITDSSTNAAASVARKNARSETVAGAEHASHAPEEQRDGMHLVKKGETLWSIASAAGVSVADVKKWNRLRNENVHAGMQLRVRPDQAETQAETRVPAEQEHSPRQAAVQSPASHPAAYTVKKGDNLWSICRTFGLEIDDVASWNGLTDHQVRVGQELKLEQQPGSGAETTRASRATHVVRRGDNLAAIAKAYGVSIDDVRAWNHLDGDIIRIGQELVVTRPADTTRTAIGLASRGAMQPRVYVVREGDTLYSIAKKLGVTVSDLGRWNNIGTSIRIGQELNYQAAD